VAHKSTWRGKSRIIVIGPKAQEVLRRFFTPNVGDYLFSPARAVEGVLAARSVGRKTPRYPSHMTRNEGKRAENPKRPPAGKYTTASYSRAIARACDKAFPPPGALARREGESLRAWRARLTSEERERVVAWQAEHRWHPNQLRHTFATRVRKLHGLEAAQVLLGHSRADVTQVYAERNEQLATTVAAQVG
jgi:integrase